MFPDEFDELVLEYLREATDTQLRDEKYNNLEEDGLFEQSELDFDELEEYYDLL